MEWIIIGIVVAVVLVILIANINIVPQARAYVVERESPVRRENRQENLPHGAGGGLPTAGRYHKG